MVKTVEITLGRAFRVWWSFVWRTWVLSMPLTVVLMPVMFFFVIPHPNPGESVKPGQVPYFAARFFVVWLIFMVGMVLLQTVAMRWMLKTRWSDFKLSAVPPNFDPDQPASTPTE